MRRIRSNNIILLSGKKRISVNNHMRILLIIKVYTSFIFFEIYMRNWILEGWIWKITDIIEYHRKCSETEAVVPKLGVADPVFRSRTKQGNDNGRGPIHPPMRIRKCLSGGHAGTGNPQILYMWRALALTEDKVGEK